MSKYCRSCGAANADSAGFCNRCGQPLSASAVGGMGTVASPEQAVRLKRKIPKAGIIAVIIIILIIIAVIFIGKYKNRIVGTWEGDGTITFDSNGGWYINSWKDENIGTYKLSGNNLTMFYNSEYGYGNVDEFSIEISDSIMTWKRTADDGSQYVSDVWRKVE